MNVPVYRPLVPGLLGVGFRGDLVLIAEPESGIEVDLNPTGLDLGSLDPGELRAKFRSLRMEYDGKLTFTLFDKKLLSFLVRTA